MSIVVVTGGDGFIGTALAASLEQRGFRIRRAVRSASASGGEDVWVTGDIAEYGDWDSLVSGADSVIHLAGRAHITDRRLAGDVERFRPVNVDATMRLGESCRRNGVRRFVFVSSIGVNGQGRAGKPYTEEDAPAPVEPYAQSKLEAEKGLKKLLAGGETELVIVRPALVYGPGVKGNLLRLLKLVARGIPLPLGALDAPRSLIGLGNLNSLLVACMEHPRAAGETFLAAEPEPRSTASLVRAMCLRMPKGGKIFAVPPLLLETVATLVGKRNEFRKIAGSFEIDASKATRILDWRPCVSFDEEMDRTVAWFLGSRA